MPPARFGKAGLAEQPSESLPCSSLQHLRRRSVCGSHTSFPALAGIEWSHCRTTRLKSDLAVCPIRFIYSRKEVPADNDAQCAIDSVDEAAEGLNEQKGTKCGMGTDRTKATVQKQTAGAVAFAKDEWL